MDEHEPPCTCIRVDVDLYDVSYCELHNPLSSYSLECRREWNRTHPVPFVPQEVSDEECPF